VRNFKKMLIGVGLTDLPEGCAAGGLYGVFNAQQMKLVTDYVFVRSGDTCKLDFDSVTDFKRETAQ